MNKYKVEIKQIETYIIDVKAKNEKSAKIKAAKKWKEVCTNGTYHYYESEDAETKLNSVYNVTDTDDPFDP